MDSHYFKHSIIAHCVHVCVYLHQLYHLPHPNSQVLNFSYDPLNLNNRDIKRFSATFSIVSTVEIFDPYRRSTLLIPELSLPAIDGYSHEVAPISEQSPEDGNPATDIAGYVAETDTGRSNERENPTNAQVDSGIMDETVENAPVSQSSGYLSSALSSNCNPSSESSAALNSNGADVLDEIIWSLPPTNMDQSQSHKTEQYGSQSTSSVENLQEVFPELPQTGYVQESEVKQPAGYIQEYGEQLLGSSFNKYENELQTGYVLEDNEQFSAAHVEKYPKEMKGAYVQEYEQTGYVGEYDKELEVICFQSYGEFKEDQHGQNLQPDPIINCEASILNGYVQNCDKQSETTKTPANPLSSTTHLSMDGYMPNTDIFPSDTALLEDDADIPAIMSNLTPPPSPSHITYTPGLKTPPTFLQHTLPNDSRGYISLDDGPTAVEASPEPTRLQSASKNDIFPFSLVTRSSSCNPSSFPLSLNSNKTDSGYITSGSSATSGYISGMSTNSYQLDSSTSSSGEDGWHIPSYSSIPSYLGSWDPQAGSSMQYTAISEHPGTLNSEVCDQLDNKRETFWERRVKSLAGDDVGAYVTQSSDTELQAERQYISSKSVTTDDSHETGLLEVTSLQADIAMFSKQNSTLQSHIQVFSDSGYVSTDLILPTQLSNKRAPSKPNEDTTDSNVAVGYQLHLTSTEQYVDEVDAPTDTMYVRLPVDEKTPYALPQDGYVC